MEIVPFAGGSSGTAATWCTTNCTMAMDCTAAVIWMYSREIGGCSTVAGTAGTRRQILLVRTTGPIPNEADRFLRIDFQLDISQHKIMYIKMNVDITYMTL